MADYSMHSDRESSGRFHESQPKYSKDTGSASSIKKMTDPYGQNFEGDKSRPLFEEFFEMVECLDWLSFRDKHNLLNEIEKVLERNGHGTK